MLIGHLHPKVGQDRREEYGKICHQNGGGVKHKERIYEIKIFLLFFFKSLFLYGFV